MGVTATGEGLRAYYHSKIDDLEIQVRDKQHNLRRMEAQRNELNTKGATGVLIDPRALHPTRRSSQAQLT